MNVRSFADFSQALIHHGRLRLRLLDRRRRATVFSPGNEPDALRRIYVINLDRRPDRWRRVHRELNRFRSRHGERLPTMVRRFSAIDARYVDSSPTPDLTPRYTLADQLTIAPNAQLQIGSETRARTIGMTKQEIAVALSHIEVWKLIAEGDVPSALVLEDDVFLTYGFASEMRLNWSSLNRSVNGTPEFDLLYLAFNEVANIPSPGNEPGVRRRVEPGIWEASGYVLSQEGARKLLDQLPVYGPVDLWLNLQFDRLRVFTAARPLIEQRIDEPSTNSYSVLPVLSQVGVITREKPLVPSVKHLPGPIVAIGGPGTGLTALSTALSMLGYTVVSDLDGLPTSEERALLDGSRGQLFNAYVNIGSFSVASLVQISQTNPDARFIITSAHPALPPNSKQRTLLLDSELQDKWEALSTFLRIDYPSFPYPSGPETGHRSLSRLTDLRSGYSSTDLKPDVGPWVLKPTRGWRGIPIETVPVPDSLALQVDWTSGRPLDQDNWELRDDTFPSNLAFFTPANVTQSAREILLTLRREVTAVRELTSGSIASTASYRYGSFKAELQPPRVSGLVTGMFLHRNGPRQEIDIEFLGKDTSKMLINVFYNPGPETTKLEYGYRGTPTIIDLGFDAAEGFHTYEIDWRPNIIRWLVDGECVYERNMWQPTPIPDEPLQFNLNLWHSRSKEFAGGLAAAKLPASASIRSMQITSSTQSGTDGMDNSRNSEAARNL